MSTPPDSPGRFAMRPLAWIWRAALLVAGTLAGSVLTAGPMIVSEWDGLSSPATMRIVIALITGLILLPVVIPGLWWKPLGPALAGTFGPAIIAAVTSAWEADEDYSFLLIGVPVMFGGALIMAIILPSRPFLAGRGRCPACGYDLRAAVEERCPECGAVVDVAAQTRLPRRTAWRWLAAALAGFVVASIAQWNFTSFLMSLG